MSRSDNDLSHMLIGNSVLYHVLKAFGISKLNYHMNILVSVECSSVDKVIAAYIVHNIGAKSVYPRIGNLIGKLEYCLGSVLVIAVYLCDIKLCRAFSLAGVSLGLGRSLALCRCCCGLCCCGSCSGLRCLGRGSCLGL